MCQTQTQIQRMVVQSKLESIAGVKKVYYQPPSSIKIEYPCIIYNISNYVSNNANNDVYLDWPRYTVTVISKNPESSIPDQIKHIRGDFIASFSRFYTTDNLNHWVFDLVVTKSNDN